MDYLKTSSLLFASVILLAISCGTPNDDASQVTKEIAERGDTISPAADETKGMDNTIGYGTVQMSTDYDKMIPFPEEMIKAQQRYPVYLPDRSSLDLSPERYHYRYLLPETGEQITSLENSEQQPPLFAASCNKAPNPLNCSNERLRSYLQEHASTDSEGELVYAYITIDEKGNIERIDQLELMEGELCADCTETAREIVHKMPRWEPARLSGTPVKSQAVIPIFVQG